jgi:hypothetical protein
MAPLAPSLSRPQPGPRPQHAHTALAIHGGRCAGPAPTCVCLKWGRRACSSQGGGSIGDHAVGLLGARAVGLPLVAMGCIGRRRLDCRGYEAVAGPVEVVGVPVWACYCAAGVPTRMRSCKFHTGKDKGRCRYAADAGACGGCSIHSNLTPTCCSRKV